MLEFLAAKPPRWVHNVFSILFGAIWLYLPLHFIRWFPRTVSEIVVNFVMYSLALVIIWHIVAILKIPYHKATQKGFPFRRLMLGTLFCVYLSLIPISIVWPQALPSATVALIIASIGPLVMIYQKKQVEGNSHD